MTGYHDIQLLMTTSRYTPTQVHGTNQFEFPYQIDLYSTEGNYPLPYVYEAPVTEITLNGEAQEQSYDHHFFVSDLNWNEFRSIEKTLGKFPVKTYAVKAYGDTNAVAEVPESDSYSYISYYGSELTGDNQYWSGDDVTALGIDNHLFYSETPQDSGEFYVHYALESWYNYAFLTGGIYNGNLFDDTSAANHLFGTTEGVPSNGIDSEILVPAGETAPSFVIRPAAMRAQKSVKFDNSVIVTSAPEIANDASMTDAEAVYYNLQGQQIANPEKGQFYIMVRGSKAQKLIF